MLYDPGRLQLAGSQKSQAYPVMYPFPPLVALCDQNPPTLQTDGQTDRRTSYL